MEPLPPEVHLIAHPQELIERLPSFSQEVQAELFAHRGTPEQRRKCSRLRVKMQPDLSRRAHQPENRVEIPKPSRAILDVRFEQLC